MFGVIHGFLESKTSSQGLMHPSNHKILQQLLTNAESKKWDESNLRALFEEDSRATIKKIPLQLTQRRDKWLVQVTQRESLDLLPSKARLKQSRGGRWKKTSVLYVNDGRKQYPLIRFMHSSMCILVQLQMRYQGGVHAGNTTIQADTYGIEPPQRPAKRGGV